MLVQAHRAAHVGADLGVGDDALVAPVAFRGDLDDRGGQGDEDDCRRGHQDPQGTRLGPRGHRRLLQDLHPRGLSGGPVRASDPPPAMSLPPVHLRRDPGLRSHLRSGAPPLAAAEDHRRRPGLPDCRRAVPRTGRPQLLGARMSPTSTPKGAAGLRTDDVTLEELTEGSKAKGGSLAGWLDERTSAAKPTSYLLKKVFPDHWSFMLGEIAMFSLIILLVTGTFLTFWFVPSAGRVIYNGSYVPLRGIAMSEAFKSTVDISFDVRGGLIMRQIHHWSALMFTVAITVHMFRIFFTGAFRKPREINWVIGTILSLLAINEGFTGYS